MRANQGKVITVRGPVEPSMLGGVMMHEHVYCAEYAYNPDPNAEPVLATEETDVPDVWRRVVMDEAVPCLKACTEHGCGAFVEATMMPWRAWPTFYIEVADAAHMHIILCTGFYREVDLGTFWAHTPEDQIWPFVRTASVEELAELCIRDVRDGIHGTDVHAGAIKLGTSQPEITEAERKTFLAGARAQQATGVSITTHCNVIGCESTQLELLDDAGVDLNRVVVGHTTKHLLDPACKEVCLDWMRRGANFLPTGLWTTGDLERYRTLVNVIHEAFDAGLGDRLVLSLDWAFDTSDGRELRGRMPPPPFIYLFTKTLPVMREFGLTPDEEHAMLVTNPQRILPVQ